MRRVAAIWVCRRRLHPRRPCWKRWVRCPTATGSEQRLEVTEMIRALYSAASGMNAQQMHGDNIAHNLANANTAGYKMRRTQFQDLLYQNRIQPGASAGQQTVVPTG